MLWEDIGSISELRVDADTQDILLPMHDSGKDRDYLLMVDQEATYGVVDWGPGSDVCNIFGRS